MRVRDATRAVPALEVKIEIGRRSLAFAASARSKRAPMFSKHLDARRPFLDAQLDRALVAEPSAGDERVLHVRVERVARGEHGGDPALRVLGVRLVRASAW